MDCGVVKKTRVRHQMPINLASRSSTPFGMGAAAVRRTIFLGIWLHCVRHTVVSFRSGEGKYYDGGECRKVVTVDRSRTWMGPMIEVLKNLVTWPQERRRLKGKPRSEAAPRVYLSL
jgi:hypothetical protein